MKISILCSRVAYIPPLFNDWGNGNGLTKSISDDAIRLVFPLSIAPMERNGSERQQPTTLVDLRLGKKR